jgi:peptidylglycine monooxygenase
MSIQYNNWWIIAGINLIIFHCVITADIEVKMPNVHPTRNDLYLCHSIDVSNEGPTYVRSFEPMPSSYAHHMLVYTCDNAAPTETAWDCGEMHSSGKEFSQAPVCNGDPKLIYAWAMDAPGLVLPPDVSFKIGDASKKFVVLQVHYKVVDDFKKDGKKVDNSGVQLKTSSTPTKKIAGIYLLLTDGVIPPQSRVYMEAACEYDGKVNLHPFAYRTHAHQLGELVTGYVIHNNKWTELGRKSPQKPQMFYNVTHKNAVVRPGDILAARCIMNNRGEANVWIGSTMKDEMCNFYMMYWVPLEDEKKMPDRGVGCSSQGWPLSRWDRLLDVSGEPITSALVPGEIVPRIEHISPQGRRLVEDMEQALLLENELYEEDV